DDPIPGADYSYQLPAAFPPVVIRLTTQRISPVRRRSRAFAM
ncbi:unnamed protein product, partial [marine sediment metagenome]